MPFDSTGFNDPPRRPEPSRDRRPGRFILFAVLWGAVLAGGPVALMAWGVAHGPANDAACDRTRGRPEAALDAPDAPRAGTPVHALRCDTAARRAASRHTMSH